MHGEWGIVKELIAAAEIIADSFREMTSSEGLCKETSDLWSVQIQSISVAFS